jgi:hypothetical protein
VRFRRAVLVVSALLSIGACVVALRDADAQKVDPRRPAVFVVGSPAGPAPMQRVDGKRSGAAKQPLPAGTLNIVWRKTTGLSVDQPALAGADGTLSVVTSRGDIVNLDEAGEEKSHVNVGVGAIGPATMTSDGTIVYVTTNGDVIGVRRSPARVRYTTRVGGDGTRRGAAPLALDDGGVVVATGSDIVVLDAEGNVRSRASLPETPAAPLVAAGDKVLVVTTAGTVFGFSPGREPVRMGSFGAPIDQGAALVDGSTFVAVIEGNHLVELDIARGSRSTRAIAAQGLYLGPPAVRQGTGGASFATILSLTPSREFVVTLDAAGQETQRAPIATHTPQVLADGGAVPLVAPSHVGPIIDARGTVAFAATDGHVGVVTSEGAVDSIGETLCRASGRSAGIAGLTPFGAGSFVVTCDSGTVVKISGPGAEPMRKGSTNGAQPRLRSSEPTPLRTPSSARPPGDD